MTAMFSDLMNGLEEVDAFLSGKTAGFKVSVLTVVNVDAMRPQSIRRAKKQRPVVVQASR
jgi:hypothetical protein